MATQPHLAEGRWHLPMGISPAADLWWHPDDLGFTQVFDRPDAHRAPSRKKAVCYRFDHPLANTSAFAQMLKH